MLSTFIVSGAHMNICVSAFFTCYGERFQLRHSGLPVASFADAIVLGQSLYAMNAEASKWGRPPAERLWNYLSVSFGRPDLTIPPARLFKAVECLEFQCTAGQVPDDWGLFRDLSALACHLARKVVTESADYASAPWHIDRHLTMAKG